MSDRNSNPNLQAIQLSKKSILNCLPLYRVEMSILSKLISDPSNISFSNSTSALLIRSVLGLGCFVWILLFIRAVRAPPLHSSAKKKSQTDCSSKDEFFSKQQKQDQLYDLIKVHIRRRIGLLEEDLMLAPSASTLCDQDGLKLESLGWWPRPLVVCNLSGVPVRKKGFTSWNIFMPNNSILRVKLWNFDWVWN